MANVLAPFGFLHVGYTDGKVLSGLQTERLIAKANGTAIYNGDPVTSLSTGYVTQSTAGTTQIAGVFNGCRYLSTSRSYTVYQRYWPGSDAAADGTALLITDPTALFLVQANGQALISHIDNNANFALGTGNASTGNSGATLDITTVATTSTLPFRIVGLYGLGAFAAPAGANGSDTTSSYNYVYVTFNNQDGKSLTGI